MLAPVYLVLHSMKALADHFLWAYFLTVNGHGGKRSLLWCGVRGYADKGCKRKRWCRLLIRLFLDRLPVHTYHSDTLLESTLYLSEQLSSFLSTLT